MSTPTEHPTPAAEDELLDSAAVIAQLTKEVAALKIDLRDLTLRNEWLKTAMFGKRSEKQTPPEDHGDAQQESLFGVPVSAGVTVEEAEEKLAECEEADRNKRKGKGRGGKQAKPKNGGGRKPVNPELRRVEQTVDLAEEEACAPDGTPYILLGFEETEREHYIPGEVVNLVIKRAKYGLPDTRETAVRAPIPAAIVAKGKYSDLFIHEIIVRKYLHGMPFERQVTDFASMGSDMSVSTLCDQAKAFAHFMASIAGAIQEQVFAHDFVHIDETPMPMQTGKKKQLWVAYADRQAFFHFGGRGADDLRKLLGVTKPPDDQESPPPGPDSDALLDLLLDDCIPDFDQCVGVICADGLKTYDCVTAEQAYLRLGCWAHARRKVFVIKSIPEAQLLLDLITELYRIEKQAKRQAEKEGADPTRCNEIYLDLRQRQSRDILRRIKEQIDEYDRTLPESHELRPALTYLLNQWQSLVRYTWHGAFPIDNNAAERTIRPVVIGRKNWLFIGSEDAGKHAAINYTIMESCRMNKMDPRAYLAHVTEALHLGRTDYDSLTPARLAKRFPRRRQSDG